MFLPKNDIGEFPLDPNEPPFSEFEIERGRQYLEIWQNAKRNHWEPPAGACPHEDYPCETIRECVEKIAWWRRYIRQIEGGV